MLFNGVSIVSLKCQLTGVVDSGVCVCVFVVVVDVDVWVCGVRS